MEQSLLENDFVIGKTEYTLQPQIEVVNKFKEDYGILKIVDNQSKVVAFIEVAASVHPTLSKVDVSKLCETLLYVFYHFNTTGTDGLVYSVLTDSYSFHIFQVGMNRRRGVLQIERYYTFTTSDEELCGDDNLLSHLYNILKFCSLL